jgi:hypothetical protein
MTITIKVRPRDPEAAYARDAISKRRAGVGARCQCGETRTQALIREKNRVICHECKRKERGMSTKDNHHVAMKANSPVKVPIPANDHRAELNVAQHDWPKATRENPDGSPLLAFAGCVRGFADTIIYLVKKLLFWGATMLETLDAFLARELGPRWWIGTELAQFAPKH